MRRLSTLYTAGQPIALALLLLTVVAARLLYIAEVNIHLDELWSIWQGFGSLGDVIRWTPHDWPPLYFIILDLWVAIVGHEPMALRYLSVLCFLIGSTFLYRVLKLEANPSAAVFAVLIFGGIAFVKFLSTELRGYSIMLMTLPMVWFFASCLYRRPRWWNIWGFAFTAATAIYSTYVTVLPILLFIGYAIWMQPRRSWRTLRPLCYAGLATALLILPLIIFILPLVFSRTSGIERIRPQHFFKHLLDIFELWFGPGFGLMCILGGFGLGAMLWRRKLNRLDQFALFWGVLSLPLMYFLNFLLGFFAQKYMSWILIGIAVFLGVMISKLPKMVQAIPVLCCCLLLTQSFPWLEEYSKWLAFRLDEDLNWLKGEIHAGDVVLFARDHECYSIRQEFDLTMNLYLHFPQGLSIVDTPTGYSRVWFVTADDSPNSTHWETLRRDYVERRFVGPPGCLFRLYEGPPDREGILFANGLRFHGAQFLQESEPLPPGFSPQLHEGEAFQVRFWWMVDEPLPQDYSVGAFLFDEEGRVIQEVHGPPDPTYPGDAPWETSRWQAGQIYYEDREFEAPYPLARQRLELRLAVYYWEEPAQRFAAPGTDALGMLPVLKIVIDSW